MSLPPAEAGPPPGRGRRPLWACACLGLLLWCALAAIGLILIGRGLDLFGPSRSRATSEAPAPSDTGLSGDETGLPGPGAAAEPGAGADPAARADPGADPGEPRQGGILHLPGAEPSTLDPAQVRDVSSAAYIYEIFSGLVTLSPELEVVPDLAEGWAVSPEATVYTFTLRSDAVFHDGTPVRAEDIVYSIERACDPALGSPVAETYLGDIVGCADKLAGRAERVAGLAAPDERTAVIRIDAPKAYFLSKLSYPTSFVVDRRQVGSDPEWQLRPNATGPFRLAAFRPEERLVLERHEAYYGSRAFLDGVLFDLRPVAAMTRYENGELDATPVGLADRQRAADPLNPLSRELIEGPGELGLSYLAFNTRGAPFDDPELRRAFNQALDKRRIAAVVLGEGAEPVDTILPPGMPGYDPANNPWSYDPEAARAALARSRYGGPEGLPPITLHTSGEGGADSTAQAVADGIGETLGIRIAVEQTPWEDFQTEVDAGRYPLYMLGWSADYPDPQDFLDLLFHSASPLNHGGYAEPEVDALLEQARTEGDEARRLALYGEAERRILGDAAWLPLFTGVESWLVAPYVRGFSIPPIVLPRLAQVWLAD